MVLKPRAPRSHSATVKGLSLGVARDRTKVLKERKDIPSGERDYERGQKGKKSLLGKRKKATNLTREEQGNQYKEEGRDES